MEHAAGVDLTAPESFRHWVADRVRFSDQDAGGHVNNAAIAVYVESGRVAFVHEVAAAERAAGARFVVARVAIDYLREAYWPGEVRIGCRVLKVGRRSFTVGTGVFKDDDCIARAESVVVHMTGAVSAPLPDALAARLRALAAG